MEKIRESLGKAFDSGKTKSIAWRKQQLRALQSLLNDNTQPICDAARKDLGKADFDEYLVDMTPVLENIDLALSSLDTWVEGRPVPTNLFNLPGSSEIRPEPLGVVCIIGPWNVNVFSTLGPLVGAISAGNCAFIKPGDYAETMSICLADLLNKYLDNECFKSAHGGPELTQSILQHHWDLIFFTGSTAVGKIIYAGAAAHLTPVILELGGKSPCVVDASVEHKLDVTAKRILWGAMTNTGQICIRPDYIFVHEKIAGKFKTELKEACMQFFGETPKNSQWLGRIINLRHFDRICGLIDDAKDFIFFGGERDRENRYIAPTLLDFGGKFEDFSKSKIMQEEVFGPVLILCEFNDLSQVISFIKTKPKPLTSHIFSTCESQIDNFLSSVSAGGLVVNDTLVQNSNVELPFGGVGLSGLGGRFQGKSGFDCFSNLKPVMRRSLRFDVSLRYPPYSQTAQKILKFLLNPFFGKLLRRIRSLFNFRNFLDVLLIAAVVTLSVLLSKK